MLHLTFAPTIRVTISKEFGYALILLFLKSQGWL